MHIKSIVTKYVGLVRGVLLLSPQGRWVLGAPACCGWQWQRRSEPRTWRPYSAVPCLSHSGPSAEHNTMAQSGRTKNKQQQPNKHTHPHTYRQPHTHKAVYLPEKYVLLRVQNSIALHFSLRLVNKNTEHPLCCY